MAEGKNQSAKGTPGSGWPQARPAHKPHPDVVAQKVKDVRNLLLAFRFINALCICTFFQPDEYFQALEPAWDLAFGSNSGAWLTWEWQHQLRSSLHPALFGGLYWVADGIMAFLEFHPAARGYFLLGLPKLLQSIFAGLSEFFMWKLARKIYGDESNVPWAALWMTVLNPWQWYCSTRTFSNSIETALTIIALYYWPWELAGDAKETKEKPLERNARVNSLRISLVLAAIAVVLRPTNLFIWLGVLLLTFTRMTLSGTSPLQTGTMILLFREILHCGAVVLGLSALSDRLYFGFWAFPPYKWLHFNVSQSLAVFYGHMDWHYYLSQGIPLLTTAFLPFALVGIWKPSTRSKESTVEQSNTLKTLSFVVVTVVSVLSVMGHKEVRFIYPLLPILHLLAAPYVLSFFTQPPAAEASSSYSQSLSLRHKIFLGNLVSFNILLAGYLSFAHQRASIGAVNFLRTEFERLHPDSLVFGAQLNPLLNRTASQVPAVDEEPLELFALFLTPCHSTPWRSHLVYPKLRARALTCEPPLDTAPGSPERASYSDETDRFYTSDPYIGWGHKFLRKEIWPVDLEKLDRRSGEIPRYIVGFEGIEPVISEFFKDSEGAARVVPGKLPWLRPVWSGWNGLFNEDWKRRGKIVIWDTGIYGDSK